MKKGIMFLDEGELEDGGGECIDHGMTRSLQKQGYGSVTDPRYKGGRSVGLHRLKYCEYRGWHLDQINGKVIRHTCDNPRCISPRHLKIGTIADNNRDRAKRGRSAKIVPSRRKLTLEDCNYIVENTVNRCKVNGVQKMAERFGVDSAVIVKVRKGEYCVQRDYVCGFRGEQ